MSLYEDEELEENDIEEESNQSKESSPSSVTNRIKEKASTKMNPLAGNPLSNKGSGGKNGGIKQAVKNVGKNTSNAIKEMWKKIPVALKIKIILIGGLGGLIILIAAAIIIILGGSTGTSQSVTNVADNYKQQIENGTFEGDQNQINQALEWLEKDGTFIGFTKDQLDVFYNANIEQLRDENRTDLREAYESNYGDTNSSDLNGKISVNEKMPLYKHILNLEKYNFNAIEWVAFNHANQNGKTLQQSELTYDNTLNLYYPNDGKTELKTLINLAKPYLFNWRFPVAFTSSSSMTEARANSAPTTIYEIQENINNKKYNSIGDFGYQIVKEGMSDIKIDQYGMSSCTLNTQYDIYREKEYQDTFTVNYYIQKTPRKDENGNIVKDENGNTVYDEAFVRSETPSNINNGGANFDNDYNNLPEINTRKNDQGNEDPMLEHNPQQNVETDYVYYISFARAYDIIKTNEYSYIPYSDSDVQSRINEDSMQEKDPVQYDQVLDEGNRYVGNEGKISTSSTLEDITAAYGGSHTTPSMIESSKNDETGVIIEKYSSTVTTGTYTMQRGHHHYVIRRWDDKLSSVGNSSNRITMDDVIKYNMNEEGNPNKSTETKESFENEQTDYQYYEDLVSREEEYINIIDLLNSNPGIISKYLDEGAKASKYIGYRRADFVYSQGNVSLKELLDELAGDDGVLPFAYGISLGYGTLGNQANMMSNADLLKEYIRSYEGHEGLADENGNSVTSIDNAKYYKVGLVDNHRTVGYGIDLETSGKEEQIKQAAGVSEIKVGDLIEISIVDAAEDEKRNQFLEDITNATAGLDLKEYQIHALVSRAYNCGSGSLTSSGANAGALGIRNGKNFVQAYNDYWNEEEDDKYEELYEQYKENEKSSYSQIVSAVDLTNELYTNYLSSPTNPGTAVEQGLINRRKSEFGVFSTGYYDRLKRFWSPGGFANAFGLDLNNSDGTANEENLLKLQAYFEENVFGNIIHAGNTLSWKSFDLPTQYDEYYCSIVQGQFFERSGNSGHTGVSGYLFQCPWWARARASLYLYQKNPEKFPNGIASRGDGKDVARNVANDYGITLYTDPYQIKPNMIISMVNSGQYGHVAYVECVDYVNGYYYVSHCGSGQHWYGVTKHKIGSGTGSSSTIVGMVWLDELL